MADALALVSRLTSHLEEQQEFTELAGILGGIEPFLDDAEKRRVKEEPVRLWLERLKDVGFDIEDALDECGAAVPEFGDGQEDGQVDGFLKAFVLVKVCFSVLASCFSCTELVNWVSKRRRIATRVRDLQERLSLIAADRNRFNFKYFDYREIEQNGRSGLGDGVTLIQEPAIYGRDDEMNMLISKLVCESSEGSGGVISIVGVSGMGKTTVARIAYNDPRVKTHFDLRIWVCKSFKFDEVKIAREILDAIGCKTKIANLVELEHLSNSIRVAVDGKKLLLVLDIGWDPRNVDFSKGYFVWKLRGFGARGSRVLVTARTESIAKMMGSTSSINLSALSPKDSWLMFSERAFFGRGASECQQLEKTGKKILRMCNGLPLAIKVIGGLMHFKNTRGEWESVWKEMKWELGHAKNIGIFDVLLFSYHDLPPALRCCFSYCAIFPKDHVIERENLIKMWMSQGYLGFSADRSKDKEILGQEYFMCLAMRSFFQDFDTDYEGSIVKCKLHDIVLRLAQYVTRYECFITGVDSVEDQEGVPVSDFVLAPGASAAEPDIKVARHSTFFIEPGVAFPISPTKGKRLRTLFTLCSVNKTINPEIFLHLIRLRTLNLSCCWFKELPEEVGHFIHLRYLNLSSNGELERLPETLCELSNLQTLLINNCMGIRRLPEGMGKLVNLRHLHIGWSFHLKNLPRGISKLTSLQTLDMLVVPHYDEEEVFQLGDLKNFDNLEGYLHIRRCGNLGNVSEAQKAELISRRNLADLSLDFGWTGERILEDHIILEALQPHPNLKSLEIQNYRSSTLSLDWMMLINLRRLILHSCIKCESLPPLGKLPSLESLEICRMSSIKKVGFEFMGIEAAGAESSSFISFPRLRELSFSSLFKWNEWVGSSMSMKEGTSIKIMPCLDSLEIDSCCCLKVLPDFLKMVPLQNLTIRKCNVLEKHCKKEKGKEWFKISHIPNIKIF